jgi:hypothetical protein
MMMRKGEGLRSWTLKSDNMEKMAGVIHGAINPAVSAAFLLESRTFRVVFRTISLLQMAFRQSFRKRKTDARS